MNWIDLLRMSSNNLKRRKLRTFLTVLGVVIGTTSIVVMISLGLGMQKSLYDEVGQSGGLTSISVTGAQVGDSMISYASDGDSQDSNKYIDDNLVKQLGELEHVKSAYPQYEMTGILLKGKYEQYVSIEAMPHDALEALGIKMTDGGKLPAQGGPLEFVYGNGIITMFMEKGTGKGYYETGELPDINLEKDPMFLILDQDAYSQSQSTDGFGTQSGVTGDSGSGTDGGTTQTPVSVQKHVVQASGVVEGGPEDYNSFYYYAYCDLDVLRQVLKKDFSGRVIPGQPANKAGKPYKDFYYTSAKVNVDDINNVDAVAETIRQMGYNVETNVEYLNSMKKEFAMIQAVLGGIGAISLFVAAIGIANTMMMSIYERTKEIGVIKVLGCSLKDIRMMFLMEAAGIGVIGGVVGNILSFILSAVINVLTGHGAVLGYEGDISYIPIWLCLLSMGFAIMVGVLAGYFPAKRAMQLSPLAAIRNE